jgi:hypothetical protein
MLRRRLALLGTLAILVGLFTLVPATPASATIYGYRCGIIARHGIWAAEACNFVEKTAFGRRAQTKIRCATGSGSVVCDMIEVGYLDLLRDGTVVAQTVGAYCLTACPDGYFYVSTPYTNCFNPSHWVSQSRLVDVVFPDGYRVNDRRHTSEDTYGC